MQVQDAQSQHGPHSASALQAGGHAPCLTEASSAAMWRVLEEGEGAARVVVSAVAPFVMLGCNAAFVELLGHAANGSALKILHGQTTRFDALESVIVNASKGGAHVCQLRLYSAAGDARLVRVEAKLVQPQDGETARQSTEGGVKMMLLSLMPANHICRAIDLMANGSGGAWVVVKNKAPFRIETVSPGWSQMYGMPAEAFLGRSLRVVEGPDSDLRVMNKLLALGVKGVEGRESWVTYTGDGKRLLTHFSVAPLLSASGSIESFVAQAYSYIAVDLAAATAADQGYLLMVAVQGHPQVTHASQDLRGMIEWGDAQACDKLIDSTVNNQVVRSLITEVMHGAPAQRNAHIMILATSRGTTDARVEALPVVDAQGVVTHLLLNLELGPMRTHQGQMQAQDENIQLSQQAHRLEEELQAARQAQAISNSMAEAAVSQAESLRMQLNQLMDLMSRGEPLTGMWTEEDEMQEDEWGDSQEVYTSTHGPHCMYAGANLAAQRGQANQDAIEVSFVKSFAAKFQQGSKEQAPTGLSLCDAAGSILWCNQVFVDVTGYNAHEVVGCQWHTFLCGPDTDCAEVKRVQAMMEMRLPFSSCMRLYQEDGRVRCMQVRLEPALTQHKHGVLPVLLLCLEDVTDVMDGCPGRILAGSAASSSSAQSLFRTSQIQEEAIVTGLSALELMSDEAQNEQLEQQRHAACEPSFMYDSSYLLGSREGGEVAAMRGLSLSSIQQTNSSLSGGDGDGGAVDINTNQMKVPFQ